MNRTLFSVLLMTAAWPLAATAQIGTDRVDQRQSTQQQRINEGVKKGELTKSEADRLQKGQQRVQKMEDKAKADGVVNLQERQKMERAQDKQSRDIERERRDRQQAGKEGKHRGERDHERREKQRN